VRAIAQKASGGLVRSVGSGLEYLAAWTLSWFEDDSQSARRWRELALRYSHMGVPLLDRMSLERSIAASPRDIEPRVELGMLLLERGDLEQARKAFEGALSCEYSHKGAVRGMATTLHRMGKLSEAAYFYLSYLSEEPEDAEVLVNLGIVLDAQGEFELAIERFRKALELKPDSAAVHILLARALMRTGNLGEARHVLSRAVDLDPRNSEAHRFLGHVAQNLGEKAEAERLFEKAIECDENNPHAYLNLSQLLNMDERDPNRTVPLARSAREIFHTQGDQHGLAFSLWEIGWAEYLRGNWKESAEASAQALENEPELLPVRFNRALALLRGGDSQGAEREYARTLEGSVDVSALRTHGIADLRKALKEDPQIAGGEALLHHMEERDRQLEREILERAAATRSEQAMSTIPGPSRTE